MARLTEGSIGIAHPFHHQRVGKKQITPQEAFRQVLRGVDSDNSIGLGRAKVKSPPGKRNTRRSKRAMR